MSSFKEFLLALPPFFFLLCCVATLSHAAPIGEATSARNDVTGQLGGVAQPISVGTDVSSDETVRTGTSSSTELRFLDNATLNIGADSTVILDRYIYDPGRSSTDSVFSLTKGALRFVGSGLRARNSTIDTPVGTIGIRGTILAIVCDVVPACLQVIKEGTARICPVPTGTVIDQSLREACLRGDTALLPCGYYDITAEEEQTNDDEGNLITVQNNCVVTGPQNVDIRVFDLLEKQIASGGPLPDPFQLASIRPVSPLTTVGRIFIPALVVTLPIAAQAVSPEN